MHSSNAHAQPCSGARCLIFGRTLRLLPYVMCANSEGSGETGCLYDKYHNPMSWIHFMVHVLMSATLLIPGVNLEYDDKYNDAFQPIKI